MIFKSDSLATTLPIKWLKNSTSFRILLYLKDGEKPCNVNFVNYLDLW